MGQWIHSYSKSGAEWSDRLPVLAKAFAALRTDFILDGELCLCDDRGLPNFRALHAEMCQGRPDTSRMAYFAFDLLFERDVDLRQPSLAERQRDLVRLCDKGRKQVPCLYLVESFPEGVPLLEWCANYGLEGIVSKRLISPYSIGACRNWVKVKNRRLAPGEPVSAQDVGGQLEARAEPTRARPKEKARGTGACAGALAGSCVTARPCARAAQAYCGPGEGNR
jgi:ATP-dependent DNA ligase